MPKTNITVEGGIRPINRAVDQPVFYRIAPAIGYIGGEVGIIADQVVPVAALPDIFFAAIRFALGGDFRGLVALWKKLPLSTVSGWGYQRRRGQGPDGGQMIGQNDDCFGADGVLTQVG